MAAYLVTHSLLSSWLHLIRENPYEDLTTEGDPLAEFMLVLRRKPTPRTEAMQNGIDFENLVTSIVNGHDDPNNPWSWAAGQIAAIIKGGQLQFKSRKTIQVRGMDVVLYGRLDALKAGTIYDIKFSRGYERGKFYSSTQHPTYMLLIPEAQQFSYLVSNGMDVWTECYRRDETPDIRPIIRISLTGWMPMADGRVQGALESLMTGRLVDMSFSLNRKQRITLEVDSDFRSLWDKLNQEPLLDIEIKKHRNKRSHSANAYFHVLVNKIAAETGESDDLVKERLVVAYGTVARDKDGCTVGFKLPVSVDVHDLYKYTRCFDVREEDGKWFNCYLVYKDTSKMDTKEFSHLIDGAIDEAKALGIETDTPEQLARYKEEWSR